MTVQPPLPAPRWGTYVRHSGEQLKAHWTGRFSANTKLAFVCGIGFDPRMCLGLEMLRAVGAGPTNLCVHAVEFSAPGDPLAAASGDAARAAFSDVTADLNLDRA